MRTRAVWALRALWFLLPLTVGQAGSDAIASADHAVPFVMTAGLWILWAAGMVATMVPVPVTLTAIRVLAAGTIPLATWALVDTDAAAISILAIGHAAALGLVALNSLVGDRFVDGSSYGDERRMLLRPPSQIGYALAPVVTALMVTGAAAGPLLLANKQWILGVIAMALGAGALAVGLRALNQMSQRWVIFVPTGMVIHDLTMMTEPVLFRRTAIERLGAAIAGSPARDLSNTAAGLLLECELTDPAPLGLRDGGGRSGATLTDVRRFLFCPSRPGDLLDEAERRNIPTD
ncbi:MAG: hypothetical protein ACI88C_002597 [Acidimicrobiales bacterium]|jgi:hypothetical protein